MRLPHAQDCDSKRIECVAVYGPKLSTGRFRLYHVAFFFVYLLNLGWVISTIGEPYRQFLLKADREGFQVMEGAHKLRAEFERSLGDIDDPQRRVGKLGWMDWMEMDIEELAAEKKRDKEKSVLDSLPKHMRVPPRYAAGFWPSLCLGIWFTLHALVLLLQYWRVGFNVWINYRPIKDVEVPEEWMQVDLQAEENRQVDPKADSAIPDRVFTTIPSHLPTHARIVPTKGSDVLLPLEYYPTLGMTFEYHRRRYAYRDGSWHKIRCRTDLPLEWVAETWNGFPSPERRIMAEIRYGANKFSVKQPSFLALYKAQLLNPFSVFQVFCVLLWAIDDYIIYSLFSLFMVLMFEGTVVLQRLQSMKALRGMGNPSRLVYVFRSNRWERVDTTALLPGDILSLTRVKPEKANKATEGGDIVPADLLLLRGSAVVNEASLTGESVPQMKEGLVDSEAGEHLSMKNKHKMNVAYAGTKMLQCKGDDGSSQLYPRIPVPPDNGCVCFVLRTGFASAQGKLVRMIEGSQEKVKGHERETGLLLLLLCFFAIVSSGYVLYHGIQDEKRSKYELLLHCILIVTSVIRPELPMQMAFAVNNSLMTLMKLHVFCTEPYRVPVAGKLDSCLFDKTGTLTTDELVAVGVCEPKKLKTPKGKEEDSDQHFLTPMMKVHGDAGLVLAGCHSLVVYDNETTGDPLESAALSSMRWHLSIETGRAVPAPATEKKPAGKSITLSTGQSVSEVEIVTRHHFSSKLQRMSCVVRTGGASFVVAKGSPEALGRLLALKPVGYDDKAEFLSKQGYRVIALATKKLATPDDVKSASETRASCESDLVFAGFIAFTCMVRKDTAQVLMALREGGMSIAMVTGDALLTAIHVAKEVRIIEAMNDVSTTENEMEVNEELRALLEKKQREKGIVPKSMNHVDFRPVLYLSETESGGLEWTSYADGSNVAHYSAVEIPSLSQKYDLAMSGKLLTVALETDPATSTMLSYVKVFARMTPDAKETVIECLHSVGIACLMCGDGANDVGALKQADVGVALLSGFGNINVDKADDEEPKKPIESVEAAPRAIMSQAHLNEVRAQPIAELKRRIRALGVDPTKYPDLVEKEDLVQLYQIKAREVAVKRHDEKNKRDKSKMSKTEQQAERKREMAEKQQRMFDRVAELEAQGVQWAQFKAMREFWAEEQAAARKKKGELAKARGVEGSAATLAAQFEDMEAGDIPMVKLGDASIAAPFTSKMPSIKNCVDIVRQGRCTLVSSIQMVRLA